MSPTTHLLASWIVAAKTTNNPRDCRLVTLAGILPDADGLGMVVVDLFNNVVRHTENFHYYLKFHHWYTHGVFGAVLTSALLAGFARQRWRVLLLCLVTFHLHLLWQCDFVGSRGPSPGGCQQLRPIYYLGLYFRGTGCLSGMANGSCTAGRTASSRWYYYFGRCGWRRDAMIRWWASSIAARTGSSSVCCINGGKHCCRENQRRENENESESKWAARWDAS